LERNKEAQTTQLQDLQNELKSLKSLLLNRTSQRSFTPGTGGLSSSASAPGLNANLPPNTNGTTNTTTEPLNAANMSGTDPNPSATAPSTSSPYLTNRPGIPAWQLAAREKAQNAGKAEEESTQTA
jgi:peroxin-14